MRLLKVNNRKTRMKLGPSRIRSVTLSDILDAKVLNPFPLTLNDLHTMVLNRGALKTCAEKLLAPVTLNILGISLTITQHKS